MVGGHVAALPARTLAEEACDFVARDEGLYAIVDLARRRCGAAGATGSVEGRGLVYRSGQGVVSNPAAPLVMDVETRDAGGRLGPAADGRYRAHNWHCFGHLERQPYAAIYTTLGCPYHCSFCCIQAPFKAASRCSASRTPSTATASGAPRASSRRSTSSSHRYGVRNIKIADEMFVLNARHVLGICDLLIERDYDLNIWAYARVDTVKRGHARQAEATPASTGWRSASRRPTSAC